MSNCIFPQAKAAIILHFRGWPAICSVCFGACNSLRHQAQSMWSTTPKSPPLFPDNHSPFSFSYVCFLCTFVFQYAAWWSIIWQRMSQAVKNKSSSCWRSSICWYLRQTNAEDCVPSPASLHAAVGSRNTWSLPDWHIHFLSFMSKQSRLLAFEKIMLRNLLPATPRLVSEIYLADLSGKSHSWFPCASLQFKRDSIPFCTYWKNKYFIIFLSVLQLHFSLFPAVLGILPCTASDLPFSPAFYIHLTRVINFSVNQEGLEKGISLKLPGMSCTGTED